METKLIKEKIFKQVKSYYKEKFEKKQEFIPCKTKINYAGRVFDEKEMLYLVDSSPDFWLTEGRFSEEFAIDKNLDNEIILYYGVRSEDLLLFTDILLQCENRLLNFKKVIFVEGLESDENDEYRKGILDIDKIFKEVEDNNAHFYLSGPYEMIKKFRRCLVKHMVTEDNIHIDEWE